MREDDRECSRRGIPRCLGNARARCRGRRGRANRSRRQAGNAGPRLPRSGLAGSLLDGAGAGSFTGVTLMRADKTCQRHAGLGLAFGPPGIAPVAASSADLAVAAVEVRLRLGSPRYFPAGLPCLRLGVVGRSWAGAAVHPDFPSDLALGDVNVTFRHGRCVFPRESERKRAAAW